MNFSSIKNLNPMVLYLVSVICFVVANVVRDKSMVFYYILIITGVLFFVVGLFNRSRK